MGLDERPLVLRCLADPNVLLAAWNKVQHWYETSWTPEPEYSAWRLTPDKYLLRLGEELANGRYSPDPFPLIPYPKKGARIRHYTMPSVRDQVAFMVFAVLLGPIVEGKIPNFSFGNRLYRRPIRSHSGSKHEWRVLPFSLSDRSAYQPYRRAHGLFRRCCHWAASALLGDSVNSESATGQALTHEDFPENHLPPFVRPEFWTYAPRQKEREGFWARLDLQLAYPSVRIAHLRSQLDRLVSVDANTEAKDPSSWIAKFGGMSNEDALSGYPTPVSAELLDSAVRSELVSGLTDALSRVRYTPWDHSPEDLWLPFHTIQELPKGSGEEYPGLPTGLAASGFLLNAYLHHFDQQLGTKALESSADRSPFALFRFADDLVILSSDRQTLAETLDIVTPALEATERKPNLAGHCDRTTPSNLRLNFSKIEPPELKSLLDQYLKKQWDTETCEGCGELVPPPNRPRRAPSFASWIRKQESDALDDWNSATLRRDRLGHFVTYLVERMSSLTFDTLDTRFGLGAYRRLVELQELVRFDVADDQVRADTRLSFAAASLARAWIPEEDLNLANGLLSEIRTSVGFAIGEAPWKFQLWRAAVRVGARRVPNLQDTQRDQKRQAENWLQALLKRISTTRHTSFEKWPTARTYQQCSAKDGKILSRDEALVRLDSLKEAYESFLRASFWRAASEAIAELGMAQEALNDPNANGWTSRSWIFRGLDEAQLPTVFEWLRDPKLWIRTLYSKTPKLHWWETMSLSLFALSGHSQLELLDSASPEVPTVLPLPHADRTGSLEIAPLLRHLELSNLPEDSFPRWNVWSACLHGVRRAEESDRVALTLLVSSSETQSLEDYSAVVSTAETLGLLSEFSKYAPDDLAPEAHRQLRKSFSAKATAIQRYSALRHYANARKVSIQRTEPSSKESTGATTLHKALWSIPTAKPLAEWAMSPGEVPALGFPETLALRFFREGLGMDSDATSPVPWRFSRQAQDYLAQIRRWQFSEDSLADAVIRDSPPDYWLEQSDFRDWECYPHPAFFLPASQGNRDAEINLAWQASLQFLTACCGDERVLDQLWTQGLSPLPFEQRWDLREQISLPSEVWSFLESVLRNACREGFRIPLAIATSRLRSFLDEIAQTPIKDGLCGERLDIQLAIAPGNELPIALSEYRGGIPTEISSIQPDENTLAHNVPVRIAQTCKHPDWAGYLKSFPKAPQRKDVQTVMAEVASAISMPTQHLDSQSAADASPELIVLPEFCVPPSEVHQLREQVRSTRRAILAGQWFRALAPAIGRPRKGAPMHRFFVNEAVFFYPIAIAGDHAPPQVRKFVIRKPNPTHQEFGFAKALTQRDTSAGLLRNWILLSGKKWHRFVHPSWGDFSVAICSDLIDSAPWRSFRGEMLHLLMCSYNTDVDLYEALTWVRAYENYCNVVATNHGEPGGSFAWTPKHRHRRELAKLRGSGLLLVADVVLPVRQLLREQQRGVQNAVVRECNKWLSHLGKPSKDKEPTFKSPPPGFQRS